MTPSREQLLVRWNEAPLQGAVEEAGAAFEAALAQGACPEVYEGLAWIAWWKNDGSATISRREEAFCAMGRLDDEGHIVDQRRCFHFAGMLGQLGLLQ